MTKRVRCRDGCDKSFQLTDPLVMEQFPSHLVDEFPGVYYYIILT